MRTDEKLGEEYRPEAKRARTQRLDVVNDVVFLRTGGLQSRTHHFHRSDFGKICIRSGFDKIDDAISKTVVVARMARRTAIISMATAFTTKTTV